MDDLNTKDGQLGNANQPLTVSDSEPKYKKFSSSLEKYDQISHKIRLAAIEKVKKKLEEVEKSAQNKYYPGSKSERLKLMEEEKELLEKMDKLAETKQK